MSLIKSAKEYENVANQLRKLDEAKTEDREIMIKDAIRSMEEKVKKYGTSQDPSEWVDDPIYSEPSTHRGFAIMISYYKKKYVGLARQLEPLVAGGYLVNLQSGPKDTAHEAGKELIKLIDIFRGRKSRLKAN